MAMRTARFFIPRSLTILLTAACGLTAAPVSAQTDGEFSVQRFEPAAGPRNFLSVAGARVEGDLDFSAGMLFDYQRDPFVITSCVSATDCSATNASNPEDVAVVQDMMTFNLLGSLTPVEFVQIGLRVPIVLSSGDGIDTTTGTGASDGLSGTGVGDVNLEGKFRIYGEPEDVVVLGVAADLSAPLGHATSEGSYIGNATPITGGIRGIVDFSTNGFIGAVNLRGVFKENATFGNTTVGPEFRWGAAAGYQFHEMFRGIVEGYGSTIFETTQGTNTAEIDAALQATPLDGQLMITLGGGAGVLQGIGVPLARGIIGLVYTSGAGEDSDGDGIEDSADQCPTEAEDRDGVNDSDGCPEDDFDHDNVPDEVDTCPLEPETENQYKDDDGCPDNPSDKDKDGFWDEQDKCPEKAGKMRRAEFIGCPDVDADGVPDTVDKCIGEKEDTDGFEDLDGCIDPDNDGDGVPDLQDECGEEKETMNGVDDEDGCPD